MEILFVVQKIDIVNLILLLILILMTALSTSDACMVDGY